MAFDKKIINILKNLEMKKIEKINLVIKKLFDKKNKNMKQLKILCDYQSDYYVNFFQKLKIGVSNIQWDNYINFLEMLNVGIKKQQEVSIEYETKIKKYLLQLSSIHIKIQLWNTLDFKITNNKLKRGIILDQLELDSLFQMNVLNNK